MPAVSGPGRWLLRAAATLTTALTVVITIVAGGGAAVADPPNLMPIPGQVPNQIERMVPPPDIPHLRSIPARAQTPGASRELQELREAIMPSPTGMS